MKKEDQNISSSETSEKSILTLPVSLQQYNPPTPGVFPIMAIGSPEVDGYTFSLRTLELLKEVGATFVQTVLRNGAGQTEEELIQELLDNAQKVGLRVVIRIGGTSNAFTDSTNLQNWLDSRFLPLVKRFCNHEALAVWQLTDEPSTAVIPLLAEAKKQILKEDTWKHIVYVNLHTYRGIEAVGYQWKSMHLKILEWPIKFKQHIRAFKNEFGPAVWSWSNYAAGSSLIKGNPLEGNMRVRSGHFDDLELLRRLSNMTNRPFWGYIQSIFNKPEDYKDAKLDDYLDRIASCYRLGTFVNLAFGAQGICWWKVVPYKEREDSNFIWAPIDNNGNPTPLYDIMRDILAQVRRMSYIFLNGNVVDIRFSTHHTVYEHFKNGSDAFPYGPIYSLYAVEERPDKTLHITTASEGFLVSTIVNGDRTFIVIVNVHIEGNKDPENPQGYTFPSQQGQIIFRHRVKKLALTSSQKDQIFELTKTVINNGKTIKVSETYNFTLKPGDWMIFQIL